MCAHRGPEPCVDLWVGAIHSGESPVTVIAADTYVITVTECVNGSISPTVYAAVPEGESQEFTISPAEGCYIVDVLVDGTSVGVVASYTFHNVTTDHTIGASFGVISANVPPVVDVITAPIDPVQVDTTISTSAQFTDANTKMSTLLFGIGATTRQRLGLSMNQMVPEQ